MKVTKDTAVIALERHGDVATAINQIVAGWERLMDGYLQSWALRSMSAEEWAYLLEVAPTTLPEDPQAWVKQWKQHNPFIGRHQFTSRYAFDVIHLWRILSRLELAEFMCLWDTLDRIECFISDEIGTEETLALVRKAIPHLRKSRTERVAVYSKAAANRGNGKSA